MSAANKFQGILQDMFESSMEMIVVEVGAAKALYGDALVPGVIIPFSSAITMTGEITAAVDEGMGGEASLGFEFFSVGASYNRTAKTGFLYRVTAQWGFNAPGAIDNPKLDTEVLKTVLQDVKDGKYTGEVVA